MPTLKRFLEEIEELGLRPGHVRLPGVLYDDLIDQAEQEADAEQNPNDDEWDE